MILKKKLEVMLLILSIALLLFFIQYTNNEHVVLVIDQNQNMELDIESVDARIVPWEKDGIVYFFLPAFLDEDELLIDSEKMVWTDDQKLNHKSYRFVLGEEQTFLFGDDSSDSSLLEKTVIFMKSDHLNAMFIDLDSGDAYAMHEDKAVKESAELKVINEQAKIENFDTIESISCRGNSNFQPDKKSYTFKMEKTQSICGIPEAKKWILLSNVFEGTKMTNKLAFDMASAMGLAYTSESQWVDLYLDGEYRGNYLLCEKIEVGKNRVDISDLGKETEKSNTETPVRYEEENNKGFVYEQNPEDITGGYLIEKDALYFYEEEESGFITEGENAFTIHTPDEPSREEVHYIRDYIQNVEDLLDDEDETVLDYLDLPSFAKRYLVDELTKNDDFGRASTYFYKEKDDDKLYAGPIWDYDGCFGERSPWREWNGSVLMDDDIRSEGTEILNWFEELFSYDVYRNTLVETYMQYEVVFEDILENRIDQYAEYIEDSMQMDMMRWDYGEYAAGHYESFDNNIRFLKYFYKARLDFFNEMYGLPPMTYEIPCTEEIHTVTFTDGDQEYSLEVKDGDTLPLEEIPDMEDVELDADYLTDSAEWPWVYERDGESLIDWLPIYEDMNLVRREEWTNEK